MSEHLRKLVEQAEGRDTRLEAVGLSQALSGRSRRPVPSPVFQPGWGQVVDAPAPSSGPGAATGRQWQGRLPWPPSVNRAWRHVVMHRKDGGHSPRVLLSKAGREYREQVCLAVEGAWTLAGRLRARMLAFPPDRRTRDLDNIIKQILDALAAAAVFRDDSQIDDLRVVRGSVQAPGWVDVVVSVIRPDDPALPFPEDR